MTSAQGAFLTSVFWVSMTTGYLCWVSMGTGSFLTSVFVLGNFSLEHSGKILHHK